MPINRSYVIMPSLGIGYIASVLRVSGHDVTILHCLQKNFTFNDFQNYIKNNDFDLIGIQMFTYDVTPTRKHINIIRKYQLRTAEIFSGNIRDEETKAIRLFERKQVETLELEEEQEEEIETEIAASLALWIDENSDEQSDIILETNVREIGNAIQNARQSLIEDNKKVTKTAIIALALAELRPKFANRSNLIVF